MNPGPREGFDTFIVADRRPILSPLTGRPAPARTGPVSGADVTTITVLDATEASRVWDLVLGLGPYWRIVGARLPFFTLGAATYIDAPRGQREYHDLASRLNPILAAQFSDLYGRLLAALGESLGAPVTFLEGFALPGFHLFQYHPELTFLRPQVHKDLQYQSLDWSSVGTPEFDRPLSFTLSIALPSKGAGLNVWPSTASRGSAPSGDSASLAACPSTGRTYHAYRVGELAMHSGLRYHQIAPMTEVLPGEERLTLQGHGLWFGKEWRVYW